MVMEFKQTLIFLIFINLSLEIDRIFLSEEKQQSILENAFSNVEFDGPVGRSGEARLAQVTSRLETLLNQQLARRGWVPARLLGKAVSVSLGSLKLNTSVLPIRGQVTACHGSPVCLDLACGRCFDPLTSIHGDCGDLSYFKCENLLPEACLPWTCAASSIVSGVKPQLRNFLPRTAACNTPGTLQLVNKAHPEVELIGLGLTLTALTACSEEPACWDEDCDLCYDPLRQEHAQCPRALTVHTCSSLPLACRPFLCWPKNENVTSQSTTVLLRDFKRSLGAC